MELETWTRRVDEVTFVAATVENDADESMRLRVASGEEPVWPPRRHGVPRSGWDARGYEGVVGAGETLALGFATSAALDADAVSVAWTEPAPAVESGDSDPVRVLGDPRPPRDAVPTPEVLPRAVRSWLDETTGRVETGDPRATDREALRRVAARARAALRRHAPGEVEA